MNRQALTPVHYANKADGDLIERTRAGDQRAFEVLLLRYRAPLSQVIYRLLGDEYEVSDVMQQVFLRLFLSLPTLSAVRPLLPWLFRVAHNCSVDHLRQKQSIPFSAFESVDDEDTVPAWAAIPDTSPSPEEVAESHDIQQRIQQAIQALPPQFRSVVLLRYAVQLSYAEIGQMLNLAEGTARMRFRRAKPLLRAALEAQGRDLV